ncbi:Cys-tRNA(Pro) deacylase, prolyl-tRNA editing enzyme YbaK/EbsC [Desulfuromusa kysingii]|uniref:Cys-tRNA(Pro) deacylase, prolyl-tRNA editing enzyme YbaK/EbsC n=1 Tax=Desulfuromusa kysingii TaxID=37625 RepID=A0A1H3XNC1_9BACT|nr:YbaK/EbsC family protein [Desulfuromusa kysingii]SEA00411.1 Cys-tRNA(Pro) deacylase, prolyl-tRNA editing enzyme YbaK/EbsC [Desulfuromusa kysingii]
MASLDQLKEYLANHNIEVWEYAEPTATAMAAASAVGCRVAEIAKTLLFVVGGKPVIVVTCGDMKVKSSPLKQTSGLSGKVKLPQADEVLRYTGYAPGGVCPFLLPADLPVFLDLSLQRFPVVYAAAGNNHSAVPVSVAQLEQLTDGKLAALCVSLSEES